MEIRDVVHVHHLRGPELIRWHSRVHAHQAGEYELHYFLGGEGKFRNGSERHVITPGALFLTPPKMLHAVQTGDVQQAITFFAVLFTVPESLRVQLDDPTYRRAFPLAMGSHRRMLFEELATRFAHSSNARRVAATHQLQAFLWDLAAEIGSEEERSASESGHFNVHIERALALFSDHLTSGITITEVARRLGITQAHLTRLFTEHMGVPPMQYYRRVRMEAAASLLLNTTKSVKEISWEMGYPNQFHFSRSFAAVAEVSPQTFRRNYFRESPTGYAGKVLADT